LPGLESETRRVTLGADVVDLTSMEFELLRILMESRGRVLSRDALLQRLRGIDGSVFDRSVDMLVSRLRKKLADDTRAPRFIKTIWGNGYQFVGAADA
jgi:DNA-binding response OmpR family regulator